MNWIELLFTQKMFNEKNKTLISFPKKKLHKAHAINSWPQIKDPQLGYGYNDSAKHLLTTNCFPLPSQKKKKVFLCSILKQYVDFISICLSNIFETQANVTQVIAARLNLLYCLRKNFTEC